MTLGSFARTVLMASCVVVPAVSAAAGTLQPPPALQGTVAGRISGPRRISPASNGFVVLDAAGRVHLLTKRGDLRGTVLRGASAVTAGEGKVFAVTGRGELVTVDDADGKVLVRASLGLSDPPTAIAYDAKREVIWMVFTSGMVQARRTDGSIALQLSPDAAGMFYRLVDVAVDDATGILWVAKDREGAGGMIFGLNPSTGERVKALGETGAGPARVMGALLAEKGRLFVSDMFLNKVAVVDANGVVLQEIGVTDGGAGKLSQPAGLARMANGDLLVSNLYSGRIERYGDGAALPACEGDADCDGMSDAWEMAHGLNPNDASDALADSDGDGLVNLREMALGTDPKKADTDGDGVKDGQELADGTDPLVAPSRGPVVVASGATDFAPGIVKLGAAVTGVADASTCTASWKQTSGTPVTLSDAKTLGPSFVGRKAESYAFTVVAKCGGVASQATTVSARVLNVAPLADVARLAVVAAGSNAQLDAKRSSDANGDSLSYAWEQVSGPAVFGGSRASLATAGLSAAGAYRFRVTAVDPSGSAGVAETQVVAVGSGRVPVAVVETPLSGGVGQQIWLDASGSLRGSDSTFGWKQVAGPQVEIADAGSAAASFVPGVPGRYAFEVTVTEKGLSSPAASVEVFVAGAGQALPVALAVAPGVAAVGSAVTLDGTGSAAQTGGALEYAWRQVSGPAAGLGSPDRAVASAYLFTPGSYEFELSVSEAGAVGVPSRVRLEARQGGAAIPVARVSAPASASAGQVVALDGSGSTGAATYRWTQVAGPWVVVGSSPVASFKAQAAGTYVFELEVDDGKVRSAPARVSVVVTGDGMEN